jgi:hypothetical protein
MNFTDAVPVKTNNPGRAKQPNPYAEIIAEIALKTQKHEGNTVPVAKTFLHNHTADETGAKDLLKQRRLLQEAGPVNTPPVSVRVAFGEYDAKKKGTPVTFWTQEPIVRTRKDKTAE